MEHPIAGRSRMPGWPVRFGGARRTSSRRRCLDNTQVKFWANGWVFDADQIDQLSKDKII